MKAALRTTPSALVASALVLTLTACLQHTYTIGTGAPAGKQVYKNWHHHWLFGLIRSEHQKELLLADHCPSGNATIHEETSFVNGLVDLLTWFIYSPTTVTILCDGGTEVEPGRAARSTGLAAVAGLHSRVLTRLTTVAVGRGI